MIQIHSASGKDPQRFRKRGAGSGTLVIHSFRMSRETRAAAWRWTEAWSLCLGVSAPSPSSPSSSPSGRSWRLLSGQP